MKATRKPLTKETHPMTNLLSLRSVRATVTVAFTLGTVALWSVTTHAAESRPLAYRTANPGALVAKLPATVHGSCKITEKLETDPSTGAQHIRRHTVCKGK